MPGLNQRGPEGRGAMTGRRQGICQGNSVDRGRPADGFAGGRGNGRGCRRGGYGRGYGTGQVQHTDTQASLQDRARILEEELKAVKNQLNAMSDNV